MNREKIHQWVYKTCATASVCILPFSYWLSSVSIILLVANWVVEGNFETKINTLKRNTPALLTIGMFLCTAAGIFYTSDKAVCAFVIQKKLSLLVFSIVFGSVKIFDEQALKNFQRWFVLAVLLSTIVCFINAFYRYAHDHLTEDFFYHPLGFALKFHAVYFSVWILLAISFLIKEILSNSMVGYKLWLRVVLLCWLSGFLFLLSSKLVIVLFLLFLLLVLAFNFNKFYSIKPLFSFCIIIFLVFAIILITRNPISKRIDDLRIEKISNLENAASYAPSANFTGVTLRILFWRFGIEILNEKHAWIYGVSSGDTQNLLNQKIKTSNLYTGAPGTKDTGYLNYNFHNQFIETTLQSGVAGLFFLLSTLFTFFILAVRKKEMVFIAFIVVFSSFFLTESALERQMGIVPFALFSMIFINLDTPCLLHKK